MYYIRLAYLILAVTFLCSSCGNTSQEKICSIAERYSKEGRLNGSILISRNGEVVCNTVFGYRNIILAEPLQESTLFYIASLAKPFTAMGVIILKELGLVDYDDRITDYLPGLPDYYGHITVRNLLNHTSGIPDYENNIPGEGRISNNCVISWLRDIPLNFSPGDKFEYSNTGYVILALLIEELATTSYAHFMTEEIFRPLGMYNTIVYDEAYPEIENRAIGFNSDGAVDDYDNLTTGDGGIFSTTGDLNRWVSEIFEPTLVSRAEIEQALSLPFNDRSGYGFGWYIDRSDKGLCLSHTGGLNGYRAVIWIDMVNKNSVIGLTNHGDLFPVNGFLNDVRKVLR